MATFSAAVKSGNKWCRCQTKPIWRLRNSATASSRYVSSAFDSKYTVPLVGVSSAASRCNKVLFPAPDGPTIAIISPARTREIHAVQHGDRGVAGAINLAQFARFEQTVRPARAVCRSVSFPVAVSVRDSVHCAFCVSLSLVSVATARFQLRSTTNSTHTLDAVLGLRISDSLSDICPDLRRDSKDFPFLLPRNYRWLNLGHFANPWRRSLHTFASSTVAATANLVPSLSLPQAANASRLAA